MHHWLYCKMVWPLGKTVWGSSKNYMQNLPYDPAIALLGVHSKNWKQGPKDTFVHPCSWLHYLQVKTWRQPKCLSMDEWILKMCYTYTVLFSFKKEGNEPWEHCAEWNKPVTKGQILCDSTSMSQNNQNHSQEVQWWLPGTGGWVGDLLFNRHGFRFARWRAAKVTGNSCTTWCTQHQWNATNKYGKFYVHFATKKKKRKKKGYMDV